MAKRNIDKAKEAKKDEFYTQLDDINKELKHYREHFRGKTVLCNCDDPRIRNFFTYFAYNFEFLGLKKLITTCYKNQNVDLFSQNQSEQAVYLIYEGDKNGNHIPDVNEIGVMPLKGDGDFRSKECIELLKEADIVVTNPPFSLFREYVAQLMEYNKKFIIIGNQNAITYKEIFPLIQDNKIWLGASIHSGDRKFCVPDDYELNASSCGIDENGKKFIRVKGVRWFTNLDYNERHEDLILYKHYTPEEYQAAVVRNEAAAELRHTRDLEVFRAHEAALRDGDDTLCRAEQVIRADLALRIAFNAVDNIVFLGQDARRDRDQIEFCFCHDNSSLSPSRVPHRRAWRSPQRRASDGPSCNATACGPSPSR